MRLAAPSLRPPGPSGDSLHFLLRCKLSSQPGLFQGLSFVWFMAMLAGFRVTEEPLGLWETGVEGFILWLTPGPAGQGGGDLKPKFL